MKPASSPSHSGVAQSPGVSGSRPATPRVSIITPCHNAEKYLGRAMQSVLAQDFTDWEYVVVDDGSRDGSAAVARSFAQADARIRLLEQANGGVCNARNNGLKACSPASEYLLFFDADDELEPNMLGVLVDYLDKHPEAGLAYCDCCHIDADGKALPKPPYRRRVPSRFGIQSLPAELPATPFLAIGTGSAVVMESCSLLRRSVYGQTLGWDEALGQGGEGIDLFAQFALLGEVHFIPQRLYRYRQYPAQAHRRAEHGHLIGKALAKWREGRWLSPEQKAKVAEAFWFYENRVMPLAQMRQGRELLRRGQVRVAAALCARAIGQYLRGLRAKSA